MDRIDPMVGKGVEKKKIELEVISPIHIGSREGRLTALEFVRSSGGVHIIDEEKFGRFLHQKRLIDQFVIEVKRGPVRLQDFLEKNARFKMEDLPELERMKIPGGVDGMQEFRPFIRDGGGFIYIPGTSLKGVFRTALLYTMVNTDQNLKKQVTKLIETTDERGLQKRFFSEKLLQKGQLQRFDLPGARKDPNPNKDLLRCLIIRDAYPANQITNKVIPIHFLSKKKEGGFYWSQDKQRSGKDLSVWVEAVIEGRFETEIIWNWKIFEEFKKNNDFKEVSISSLDDLFKALITMNRDLIEEEKKFFLHGEKKKVPTQDYKSFLKNNETTKGGIGDRAALSLRGWYENQEKISDRLFRVGFGSGMLSTTLALILPIDLRQKIRDACGSQKRPGDPAPKSRRVWRKSETECLPMGWFKIRCS